MHWQDGTGPAGDGFTATGLLWLFPKNRCVNTTAAWKRWSASGKAAA
ncbi:hypothetical protein CLOBOL_00651 [Enterocloster bolteae ATCC BAA-613]|uniref:Uncharacterized protein n=1 Tax=Enterocloster bolteae (strain ATCC BAA-613 / DSM 15670 / CCUG 46953 / JCM 12243 / WAL 16351) TaxID=411902 RepID=A8RIB8_ENTBW|nr:hypothetical protein CLOBOL_00651 [Enterocloster bolteae ATCC BAA-613]